MQLEKIISISGKPGLYKLVAQMRTGFIIEDILTKKKTNIDNSRQVSLLDNISMYTFDAEVPLFQVFYNIGEKEGYKETIGHKVSHEELRSFMKEVLPDYDVNRVYESDIKKLVQWYNLLQKGGYITKEGHDEYVAALQQAEVATEEQEEATKPAEK